MNRSICGPFTSMVWHYNNPDVYYKGINQTRLCHTLWSIDILLWLKCVNVFFLTNCSRNVSINEGVHLAYGFSVSQDIVITLLNEKKESFIISVHYWNITEKLWNSSLVNYMAINVTQSMTRWPHIWSIFCGVVAIVHVIDIDFWWKWAALSEQTRHHHWDISRVRVSVLWHRNEQKYRTVFSTRARIHH